MTRSEIEAKRTPNGGWTKEALAGWGVPWPPPSGWIDKLIDDDRIFVFGSNLAGRHGKGAALFARERCGAVYGQGTGRQGQSYAIPTKKANLQPLQLWKIKVHIEAFLDYARANPDLRFEVTKVGCGLAGFREADIAPLFSEAPANCDLPEGWR